MFLTFKKRLIFVLSFLLLYFSIYMLLFHSIYTSNNIMISFAIHPFNICSKYPYAWSNIKKLSLLFMIVSNLIISNSIFSFYLKKYSKYSKKSNTLPTFYNDGFHLKIGNAINNTAIYLPLGGLFQNILVTGTIGTGKTSSAMYPFTEQLISYANSNFSEKFSMLILDVKGNYYKQVEKYCKTYNRLQDLIVIDLKNEVKYNPLDKPNLKASILANRLKTILTLFSPNNSESFWLDKAEQILCEAIKFCRLYNNNYVTFSELHNLITVPDYFSKKLEIVKENFFSGDLSKEDAYHLLSCINFFEKEFKALDSRTLSILKSEITRITNSFISDIDVLNTFSPPKKDITFDGFSDVLKNGKIVVLNMNISEYRNLSKIIAAYLKLDFQTDVMLNLASGYIPRISVFISDEYHEYVTATDADFFAQSREAKCINIVATQSYTSLLNTINNKYTVNAITQNLINKLWYRTDDILTIEEAQKQIGKTEKTKFSRSISENGKETTFNYLTKKFQSFDSNISESINTYTQFDFIYDTNFFTQTLQCFHCLCFLSTGSNIISPQELKMIPYFKK